MNNSIIDNEVIMGRLALDKENYEANCYILKAIQELPYEKQLEVAKGLLLNDKETKSRQNKENYQKNKTNIIEKSKKNGNQLVNCPLCDIEMKKNVLFYHKNNTICIKKQEELYGPLPTIKCELCRLKVREILYGKHIDTKKCRDRQRMIKELERDEED